MKDFALRIDIDAKATSNIAMASCMNPGLELR